MKPTGMTAIAHDQAQMWQLSAERRSVRMQFGLPVQRAPEPQIVKIDLDAGAIEEIIERLMVLRAQMLLAEPTPGKVN